MDEKPLAEAMRRRIFKMSFEISEDLNLHLEAAVDLAEHLTVEAISFTAIRARLGVESERYERQRLAASLRANPTIEDCAEAAYLIDPC